jgi:putative transposase
MPRKARPQLFGIPLHVVQRGHNRATCFHNPTEYERYLGLLREFADRDGCCIHAYVLMPNHIHLLVTAEDSRAVTRTMRTVSQRYAQFLNRVYGKTGPAWQNRFWASPIDTDRYFFTCQRYIELNPVRAAMVSDPRDYQWSSYRHNALGEPSLIVRAHALYAALGATAEDRQWAYRGLFAEVIEDDELQQIRRATRGCRAFGGEGFVQTLESEYGVPGVLLKPGPKPGFERRTRTR